MKKIALGTLLGFLFIGGGVFIYHYSRGRDASSVSSSCMNHFHQIYTGMLAVDRDTPDIQLPVTDDSKKAIAEILAPIGGEKDIKEWLQSSLAPCPESFSRDVTDRVKVTQ
jgi:hypothetical protein